MNNQTVDTLFICRDCAMREPDIIRWFPELFAKLVSLATLAVLTTVVNIFFIYIVCKTKSLVANTKVFFISLCLAHLIGSILVIPLWIATRLSQDIAIKSPSFCQVAGFVWILMILASFYSLSAISLDRFFIISNPMRYPIKATTPKKLLAVTMIWLVCIMFASAPYFGWGEYTFQADAIPICGLNMKHSLSFTIVLTVFGLAAPLLVDILCCARIIAIAKRQSRAIDARKSSSGSTTTIGSVISDSSTTIIQPAHPNAKLSKLKQKLNSLRLVFAGTGSFLVCWVPYLGAHVWMITVRNVGHDQESMPYVLEFVVMCVALLNGLVNPVVLMWSNRDYKRRIQKLMFHKFGIFKESVAEERSDMDSSVAQRRRQFKNQQLGDVFSDLKSTSLESCISDDGKERGCTNKVCGECIHVAPEGLHLSADLRPTHLHVSFELSGSKPCDYNTSRFQECKRLMSQLSSSSSMDSEHGHLDSVVTSPTSPCSPGKEISAYTFGYQQGSDVDSARQVIK